MIVLDTNVISELMKPTPAEAVLEWVNDQDAARLFVTTVSVAEIEYGLQVLPAGRRRRGLEERFARVVEAGFANRVLVFDLSAARLYGHLMAERRDLGRPMGVADGQIAAIARSGGFSVATGNLRDFEDCGVDVVDPFRQI